MVKVEEIDSGVESLPDSNYRDMTPETVPAVEDDCENEEDETLAERLLGLTEMFPQSVRDHSYIATIKCMDGIKTIYKTTRSLSWIVATSVVILIAPFMLDVERSNTILAQQAQQKQILLGPNSMAHGMSGGLPKLSPGGAPPPPL